MHDGLTRDGGMRRMGENPNHFANYPLDRAAHRRREPAWLAEALASSSVKIAVFQKLNPLVNESGVVWLGAQGWTALAPDGAIATFLGVDEMGAPYFAVEASEDAASPIGAFGELRTAAAALPMGDLAILGCARWLFDWHRRHRFCAMCGAETLALDSGWRRQCPACETQHFPRIDPCVIMAPTFGDYVALGKRARSPVNRYSALAGFIEPGEAMEDAIAREVLEEANLVVTQVAFHSTQPWPFPASLMIGAIARVANQDSKADEDELEEIRWFSRAEARLLLAGTHPDAQAPGPIAIAHHLIKAWVEEEI